VAKTTGLGDGLYSGGYDLSGDIAALDNVHGGAAPLELTGIDSLAYERTGGVRDGGIEATAWHNPAAGQAHPVLAALPTTNTIVTYCRSRALGAPAAATVAKQINYDGKRAADGSLQLTVQAVSAAYGLEWGWQLTAGTRTDAGATTGTGVDLSAVQTPCLVLPGTAGAYASTPDAAALDITADIDVRVHAALDDWTPAATQILAAKWTTVADQRSWAFGVNTDGTLLLEWSEDGTAATLGTESSSVAPTVANGAKLWLRATLDVDNGAADADITFYTSADGVTWVQLGATQTNGATTSIFSSSAVLEIGSRVSGTVEPAAGRIFEAVVYDGIAGTAVAHPIATVALLADATPLTWTVNGTAYLASDSRYGLQAYLQKMSFVGTDVTVKLQHSLDDGGADAYADITGAGFTQITTTTPGPERIATSATAVIRRYVRAVTVTSGGFTSLEFEVMACGNPVAVVF